MKHKIIISLPPNSYTDLEDLVRMYKPPEVTLEDFYGRLLLGGGLAHANFIKQTSFKPLQKTKSKEQILKEIYG